MAAPTNTFLSTAAIGNRESLHDIIKILEAVTGFLVFADVVWSVLGLNNLPKSAAACLPGAYPAKGTALEPMRRFLWRRSRNDLSIG